MQYRRAKPPGATYFFTLVTHQRQPVFNHPASVESLHQAFRTVKQNHPFTIDAIVVLPDHLHCIWTLPPNDNEADVVRHGEYIHYNPVSHGFVTATPH